MTGVQTCALPIYPVCHAGQSKQDRAAGKRESAAQKKEDGFMKVSEMVEKCGYTIQKALSQTNKETGLKLSRASFSDWRVRRGY